MRNVDDILQEVALQHIYDPSEYDPVAAREYYLRTRKLKGRRHAAPPVPSHHVSRAINKTLHKKLKVAPAKATAKRKSAAAERQAAEARVKALTAKLDQLHKIIQELVKQAKSRSGIKTKPQSGAQQAALQKAQAQSNENRKLTAQQKDKKAEAAKKAYDKAHPESLSQQEQDLNAKIAAATKKIQELKAQIAEARSKAAAH